MWASCTRRCTLLRPLWVLRLAPWEAEIRTSLRRLPARTTTPRLPWGSLSWVARPRESLKFRGERFAKLFASRASTWNRSRGARLARRRDRSAPAPIMTALSLSSQTRPSNVACSCALRFLPFLFIKRLFHPFEPFVLSFVTPFSMRANNGPQKEGGYANGCAVHPGNPRVSCGLRDSLGDRLVPRRYGLQPEAGAPIERGHRKTKRRGGTQKGCLATVRLASAASSHTAIVGP